jgi:hypothetical protein
MVKNLSIHILEFLGVAKIPDEKRKKLDVKSRNYIFIGYSD